MREKKQREERKGWERERQIPNWKITNCRNNETIVNIDVTIKRNSHPFDAVALFFYNAALPSRYFTTACTDQCGSRVACKQSGRGGVWVTPFHVSLSVWLATFLGFATPAACQTLYEPWHWNAPIVYAHKVPSIINVSHSSLNNAQTN